MEKQLLDTFISTGTSLSVSLCFSDGVSTKRDYSPVSWSEYFEMMDDVVIGGQDGPLLVLLHGGGHSALSWAVFTAAMASRVTCRVLAMDLRGHGVTQVRHADDLSTLTMSRDVANVVRATYGEIPPPIILVGHNVGGAIAVHAAGGALLPSVVGLVAIDVVEGSAMEVLHSMQNFLRGRPKSFKSIDHAIEWSVKSGQIRNLESAKGLSTHALLVLTLLCSLNERVSLRCEVEEGDSRNRCACVLQPCSVYSWRIDLSKAEKYWDGWFRGISNLFLSCNVPKLLLLAGIDRLDRDLTIGQMQGKFMMQVLPPCGHAVHEDIPDKVADALASFMIRHKFAEARSETKR
uniref:Protein phosphatase methylesterase 1 n=1 Tax=Sinocyclocheilus anshuiensis TaxID=1608454 RepID=A0A671PCZ1_9TELE